MADKDVTIKVSAKDLTGPGLQQAENRSAKAFKAIGKTAAVAGAAIAGALALGAANAIKQAGAFEQSQIAFETMLGSAEKARVLLDDIAGFAASTPFELTEIQSSAKSMLAFGFAAEDIIPSLKNIGDVSAGIGVNINDLAVIYGKARTAGTLYAEDVNQLTERGVPIIRELAKQMGVAESEVKGLVSEGKVGFPELEIAFQDMAGEGGTFFNLMDKQSKSFGGQVSNMKDQVTQLMIGIGMELLPVAKRLTDFVNSSVLPAFSGFMDKTIEIGSQISGPLSQAFQDVKWTIGLFSQILNDTSDDVDEMAQYGVDFSAVWGVDVVDAFNKAVEVVKIVQDRFKKIVEFVKQDLIPTVASIVDSLIDSFMPSLAAVSDFVSDTVIPVLSDLSRWFVEDALPKLTKLAKAFSEFVTKHIAPVVNAVSTTLLPILGDLVKFGFGALMVSIGALIDITTNIVNFFNENETAADTAKGMVIGLSTAFLAVKTSMMVVATYQAIITFFTTALPAAILVAKTAVGSAAAGTGLLGSLALIPTAITIGVALVGFAIIMSQIDKIKGNLDSIDGAIQHSQDNTNELIRRMHEARAAGDDDRADRLRRQVAGSMEAGQATAEATSGIFGGLTGRANGGPVNARQPYIVGERGPEMFVPQQSGTVLSNEQSRGVSIGNVTINSGADWSMFKREMSLMVGGAT